MGRGSEGSSEVRVTRERRTAGVYEGRSEWPARGYPRVSGEWAAALVERYASSLTTHCIIIWGAVTAQWLWHTGWLPQAGQSKNTNVFLLIAQVDGFQLVHKTEFS